MWVIIALAILILLIILVLCIPIDFIFSVNINESPSYKVRLLWLFGLFGWDTNKPGEKTKGKERDITARQKHRRGIRTGTVYQILKTRGLFPQLWRLVISIITSLKIKELVINLKLGLEDPANTGFLFALAGPVNYLLSMLPYDIKFMPIFDGDFTLDAYLRGVTRLWPILIVLALLKFIFSLPALRIAGTLAVTRWKRA